MSFPNRDFSVRLFSKITEVFFNREKSEIYTSLSGKKALCVFDQSTRPLFEDIPFSSYTITPGEYYKSRETVEELSSWALSQGAGRDVTFVAIGGGVVCDLTAFVASIYMRGVDVVLVPTTVLSMVDASIGGKTGINFEGYKNILGTFYPAREVRILPSVLGSLPSREYFSGLAEVIKHALLMDGNLFKMLEAKFEAVRDRDESVTEEMIHHSLEVKKWYIERDPFEQNIRGHLNLGHTFAHALESVGEFTTWTHGEAVAWGIARAMKAGVLMGITDGEYAVRVDRLLKSYGYRLEIPGLDVERMIHIMGNDKKKKAGTVRFVLQKKHGKTFFTEIPEKILRRVLE